MLLLLRQLGIFSQEFVELLSTGVLMQYNDNFYFFVGGAGVCRIIYSGLFVLFPMDLSDLADGRCRIAAVCADGGDSDNPDDITHTV